MPYKWTLCQNMADLPFTMRFKEMFLVVLGTEPAASPIKASALSAAQPYSGIYDYSIGHFLTIFIVLLLLNHCEQLLDVNTPPSFLTCL